MHELAYSKRTSQPEDFKKIFCAYHNEEFLTNFCVDKSCLMPLCPSCIVQHTDEHYRDHSKPMYMNIHEALHHARETCYQSIIELQDSAHKIKEMKTHRLIFLEELRRKLDEHRRQIMQEIQKMFISYEKQVLNRIIREQEQEGVFNQNQIERNQSMTLNAITEIYERIGMLKGDQCLAALIMFFGEGRSQIQITKSNLKDFVLRNEKREVSTNLNGLVVQSKLQNLFQDSIQVSSQKLSPAQERQSRTASRYSPINHTSPPRNSRYARQSNTSGSKKSRIFEGAEYSPSHTKLTTSHRRGQEYHNRYY